MSYTPRRSATQWQVLVDEQRTSGLAAPQFRKEQELSYASFIKWRNRLSKSNTTNATHQPTFVELSRGASTQPEDTSGVANPWRIELELGSGICLRIAKA